MIVTREQLHNALMIYAEKEIAMKASGVTRFAAYFLISRFYEHPEKTVGAILEHPLVKMADIENPNGTIKADELYMAARAAMEKAVSVTISGITFSVPDIDKIYTILQGG